MRTIDNYKKNHNFKKEALVSCIVIFLGTSLIIALTESNLTLFVVSVGWLLFGSAIIQTSFPPKGKYEAHRLWLLVYLIYYLYMVISSVIYVDDPHRDFFFHVDSLYFYSTIDKSIESYHSYDRVLYEGRHWPGFATLSWLLGQLALKLGDTNSIILQKTQIVFVSGLTVVFLYQASRIYFSSNISWRIALSFGLLTHIFAFSGTFTRDPHITFLYTVALYIFIGRWSLRSLLILILLGILCAQFRFQHGAFFIVIVAAYVFLRVRRIKQKIVSSLFALFFVACFIAFTALMIQSYQRETVEKIETYQQYHQEGFEDASGFSGVISRLPPMLQPVGIMLISQTYPLPPTRALYVKAINGNQYLLFPLVIAQVFWIMVWGVLMYGLLLLKMWKKIPTNLKGAFIISLLLILVISTGSYEYRRMMGGYPAVYLASCYVYYSATKNQRFKMITFLGAALTLLYCFYFLVKTFIL